MNRRLWLASLVLLPLAAGASSLLGRIAGGVYLSPGGLFQVDVPTMRNPFVKQPDRIRDARTVDGGEEVTFSVLDLGEAWRYGAVAAPDEGQPPDLAAFSDQQLIRWLDTEAEPKLALEQEIVLAGGTGTLRIYEQDEASMLFKKTGSTVVREVALIGIAVAPDPERQLLIYVVGQFDMPMDMMRFHVEIRKVPRERVIASLAKEHAQRLEQMAAGFRLR